MWYWVIDVELWGVIGCWFVGGGWVGWFVLFVVRGIIEFIGCCVYIGVE